MIAFPAQVNSIRLYEQVVYNLTGYKAEFLEQCILSDKTQKLPIEISVLRTNAKDIFGKSQQRKILGSMVVKHSGYIRMHELDQFLAILRLYADVCQVITRENAPQWMVKPNHHLDNQPPVQLLQTHIGKRRVYDYLDNILSGNFG